MASASKCSSSPGTGTTTCLLGNTVQPLLAYADVLGTVRQDPQLLPGAIEEILRYESPVQECTRVAAQDLEVGGQQIAAGQALLLLLGAANRDPRVLRDPDRSDIHRTPAHHPAFGEGPTTVWGLLWPGSRAASPWRSCWSGCRSSPWPPGRRYADNLTLPCGVGRRCQ
jgi:Cytochrome P450